MHIKCLEQSLSDPNIISIQQTFAIIITLELNFHFFGRTSNEIFLFSGIGFSQFHYVNF